MKLEILNSAIKLKEKEFDKPRLDMITGNELNPEQTQEADEQTETLITQLKNKKKTAQYQQPDTQGHFLQKDIKKKNAAFVKEIEKNQDVMGMVKDLCASQTKAIEKKLEKATKAKELSALFTATDPDFQPLMKTYCSKSGSFLHSVGIKQLQKIVNILGRERALEVLRLNAVQHVSLEWLHTEPDTLNKLMINDCAGYFIYCSSMIFQTDYTIASTAGTTAPNVSNKSFDELDSLLNMLPDFGTAENVEAMNFQALPMKDQTRYLNLQDKIEARENLELLGDSVLITQANELMRKLLGLASASNIAKMGVFQAANLVEITDSQMSLVSFIAELQAAIKSVFIQFFKGMHYTKAEFIIKRLRTRTITASNIAAIQAEFKGKSNLHKQPAIKSLTNRQQEEAAILNDIMSFWDEQPEMGASVDTAMDETDKLLGCVFEMAENNVKPKNEKTINLGLRNIEGQPQIARQFQNSKTAAQINKKLKDAGKPNSFVVKAKDAANFKLKLGK